MLWSRWQRAYSFAISFFFQSLTAKGWGRSFSQQTLSAEIWKGSSHQRRSWYRLRANFSSGAMDLLLAPMSCLPSDPLPSCSYSSLWSSTKLISLRNNGWIIHPLTVSVVLVTIGQISNICIIERHVTPTSALAQFTEEIQFVYPCIDLDIQVVDPTKPLCGVCDP